MTGDEAIAFVRSLGAGTPEAVAALRALVKAAADEHNARANGFQEDRARHRTYLRYAVDKWAALATPTEEGR